MASGWQASGWEEVATADDLGQALEALQTDAERRLGVVTSAEEVERLRDRDLAVVVDESVPIGAILDAVGAGGAPLLAGLELFDRYRGEQLGAGKVSYALRLRFQPQAPTDDPDEVLANIRRALAERLAASFRQR